MHRRHGHSFLQLPVDSQASGMRCNVLRRCRIPRQLITQALTHTDVEWGR